jgi:ParB-like chromosome segregation protein Spo0J
MQEVKQEGGKLWIRGRRDQAPAGKIHPNEWNPNRMTPSQFEGLKGAILQHGFMAEILVRPHPEKEGEYQSVDGEHRTKAVRVLSEERPDQLIDIRVIDADDPEAKKITIMMNRNRGEHDRIAEGFLLRDISEEKGREYLSFGLPWSEMETDDRVAIANSDWSSYSPSGWEDDDEEGGPRGEDSEADRAVGVGSWTKIEALLTSEDHDALIEARQKVQEESGDLSDRPDVALGQVIAALAAEFLGDRA